MAEQRLQTDTAQGFLGAVFKYSISTFVNIGILGLSMVLTGVFIPNGTQGDIALFTTWTGTIMTIAILGLDQALIRFYREPPAGLGQGGLFRLCFWCSSGALWLGGAFCSVLLAAPLYRAIGFAESGALGQWVIPLLFLNAFFYMVARYFNVLYRVEGNIRVYTTQSILMQFFYKLFYILGFFLWPGNPVPAMALCSVLGLGGFALVFGFLRRDMLRPRVAEFKSGGYKALLPYSLMVAPTAVFVLLNSAIPQSIVTNMLGKSANGNYAFAYSLSNMVTLIQGGFASFWQPYMFEHYKTRQGQIKKMHNYLNLAVLCFFALLIAVEDVAFLIFRQNTGSMPIFPLMMLAAVFTILCETTVHGNAIAKKPIFDTIGIGLGFGCTVLLCALLIPRFGLPGAAVAHAGANGVMFLFRTITAQRLYRSIESPAKTVAAVLLAIALAVAGTVFTAHFWYKLAASLLGILLYILLYRKEFIHIVQLGLDMLNGFFHRRQA